MTGRIPNAVRFGREVCGSLALAECREWWITNGLGGYAAGTVCGTLTRRYHGLLFASLPSLSSRVLAFAKADATLTDGGHAWPLHTNRWTGGIVQPEGHVHIESFYLEGRMPVWRYAIGTIRLEARVWMEYGANTTYLAYRLDPNYQGPSGDLELEVHLLANARDHHHLTQAREFRVAIEGSRNRLRVTPRDWFTLHLHACEGTITPDETWVERFYLPVERARGLPDQDNHLSVGHASLPLEPGKWVGIVASLDDKISNDLQAAMHRHLGHDHAVLERAKQYSPEFVTAPQWVEQLVLAADSFVVSGSSKKRDGCEAVLAGYPWFTEWGRDTMIALPGLTLAIGRIESGRRILEAFADFIDCGMLPNVFPGDGAQPAYNTVDAALWYLEAWRAYAEVTHDHGAVARVYPKLAEIVDWYCKGTRYGIVMDPEDGLLRAGEPGIQVTWMDAKINDWVVTPRIGKPVEVNALWFNGLNILADFAKLLGLATEAQYRTLIAKSRQGFQRFVKRDGGGLIDVLDGPQGDDPTVRPNQILAVSLSHSPLERAVQVQIVRQCGRTLLCSYGLRSLDPAHREFRSHYGGSVRERDSGYHQGPVWAWLLGHYALAEYRIHGDACAAQSWLEPIGDHLRDAGLGTVSEIFDGAPPHAPRGCPAQAWSVACTIDAWWRLEQKQRRRKAIVPYVASECGP